MGDWKEIKIENIGYIEKLKNEYSVGELIKTPWSKFKVRIYERQNGTYRGIINLVYKNNKNEWCVGEGYGKSEKETLINTIQDFMCKIDEFDQSLYTEEFDESLIFKELPIYDF